MTVYHKGVVDGRDLRLALTTHALLYLSTDMLIS